MTDATKHSERWTFLGVFDTSAGKRDGWRDDAGNRHYYKAKRSAGAVGYLYDVQVDDEQTLYGSPAWTGDLADDAADLQLADRQRRDRRDAESAERRAKSNPAHAQLLADVEDFARRLSAGARSQLAGELDRAVWRAR